MKYAIVFATALAIGGTAVVTAAVAAPADEVGATLPASRIRLVEGISRAPAYQALTVRLVTANSTDIFDNYMLGYWGKVVGHLPQGQIVDAIAIVKGWDWVLVGEDGTGIGYVPLGVLCPIGYCSPK